MQHSIGLRHWGPSLVGTLIFAMLATGLNVVSAVWPLPAAAAMSVTKAMQDPLTVDSVADPVALDDTRTLATSGGSGTGLVSYSVGVSTACRVSGTTLTVTATACEVSGSTLTATAATGSCAVTATKADDPDYLSATSAAITVAVTKGTSDEITVTATRVPQATLTVNPVPGPVGVNETRTLSTTGGSGGGEVTYSVGASTACVLDQTRVGGLPGWTRISAPLGSWVSVAYGDGMFVAVSQDTVFGPNQVMMSTNGTS